MQLFVTRVIVSAPRFYFSLENQSIGEVPMDSIFFNFERILY